MQEEDFRFALWRVCCRGEIDGNCKDMLKWPSSSYRFAKMCNADAIQFIFYNMLSCFHFVLHYLLVSYNSADYGGGSSACKLVAPFFGLWDLRRCLSKHQGCTTRACDGFDAQTAQTAYLFVISPFFGEAATFAQRTIGETGWDNNPILPFWCMKRASRSGWSPEVACLPTFILVQLKSKTTLVSLLGRG